MAANCVRFLEAMDVPPDSARSCWELTRDLVRLLEQEEEALPVLPMLFRFRLAADQGYVVGRWADSSRCSSWWERAPPAVLHAAAMGI